MHPPVEWSGPNVALFFNILVNALIVLSATALLIPTSMLVFAEGSRTTEAKVETTLRIVAVAVGFLLYAGARAVGLSIPELIFRSLEQNNTALFLLSGVMFPSLLGWLVSWYVIRRLKRGLDVGVRAILVLVVLLLVAFSDVYASAHGVDSSHPGGINEALLPNLTFALSVGLYAVFQLDKKAFSSALAEHGERVRTERGW